MLHRGYDVAESSSIIKVKSGGRSSRILNLRTVSLPMRGEIYSTCIRPYVSLLGDLVGATGQEGQAVVCRVYHVVVNVWHKDA